MTIPSVRYAERLMLSLTCQVVVSTAYALRPRWFVLVPALIVNALAIALIFLTQSDKE